MLKKFSQFIDLSLFLILHKQPCICKQKTYKSTLMIKTDYFGGCVVNDIVFLLSYPTCSLLIQNITFCILFWSIKIFLHRKSCYLQTKAVFFLTSQYSFISFSCIVTLSLQYVVVGVRLLCLASFINGIAFIFAQLRIFSAV